MHSDHRIRAYDVGGNGVLLLFLQGGSLQPIETPGGSIPPHYGAGPMHVTFSIVADELEAWQDLLQTAGVAPCERRQKRNNGEIVFSFAQRRGDLRRHKPSRFYFRDDCDRLRNPEVRNGQIANADALYFTVTALTTTGFGDIALHGTFGRLISVVIMIFGVTLFFNLARA